MNKLFFLLCISISLSALADELPYDKEKSLNYLNSSDDVYLVMKIGGNLKFSEYKDYMRHYVSDEEKLIESWKTVNAEKSEKFLILKKFKGFENPGTMVWADNLSSYGTTILGDKYILFLTKTDVGEKSNFSFGNCDVFELEKIPYDFQEKLDLIIDYISTSKLNPCLYHIVY